MTTEFRYGGNYYDDYEARPAKFVSLQCAAGQLPASCDDETHVAIEYDPQDPQRARLAGSGAYWEEIGGFTGAGAFLFLIGAGSGVVVVRDSRGPFVALRDRRTPL